MAFFRSLLLISLILFAASSCSAPPPDHVAAWKEDIEYFLRAGEANHIDLYHSVSREEVAANVRALVDQLPELSENEVIVELMRIARLFGDGHTAVSFWGRDYVRLPFGFDDYRLGYSGDYRIVEASPAYESLLGQTLVSIEGRPLEEVLAQLEPITQYVENRYSQAARSREYIANAEVLNGLGIVEDVARVAITTENDEGERSTVQVTGLLKSAYRDSEKVFVNPVNRVYLGEQVLAHSYAVDVRTPMARLPTFISRPILRLRTWIPSPEKRATTWRTSNRGN